MKYIYTHYQCPDLSFATSYSILSAQRILIARNTRTSEWTYVFRLTVVSHTIAAREASKAVRRSSGGIGSQRRLCRAQKDLDPDRERTANGH